MRCRQILIANRGEIAIRIAHAAAELEIPTLAIYSEDDSASLHNRKADAARSLSGRGAAAYLDTDQILSIAQQEGCDAIHPGYGFLSENPEFARRCTELGICFIGPRPETLALFGDKTQARRLAARHNVPVLAGSPGAVSLEQAESFFAALPERRGMLIKAVAGGGGRGMRVVNDAGSVGSAYQLCQAEAEQAFGNSSLYVEEFLPKARHVEVQIIGDGTGAVSHVWERECSIQRRHQKLIEIAPSPHLAQDLRNELTRAAVEMAASVGYRGLGTFEYLIATPNSSAEPRFAFIEANARLQVEHTVTEMVSGLDLVQIQLQIAQGATLADLGLEQDGIPAPRGFAVQARVNMETMSADGTVRPTGGVLRAFDVPTGPSVRVDTFGYAGYSTNPAFDSLLAKVICHSSSPTVVSAIRLTQRALREFRIDGLETNIPFLLALLSHSSFVKGEGYTRFVDDHLEELTEAAQVHSETQSAFYFPYDKPTDDSGIPDQSKSTPSIEFKAPEGTVDVRAALQGTIVSISVADGDVVRAGQTLLVLEAMKMQHAIPSPTHGIVHRIVAALGDTVFERQALAYIEPVESYDDETTIDAIQDLETIRPDLDEVFTRRRATLDSARHSAVAKRHATGKRTARENIDDLCDEGTFKEYGQLVLTPDTGLPLEEVIKRFPGDGMVCGIGSVNGGLFEDPMARAVVLSYDYTVLAGTQGTLNHPKADRMLELAEQWRLPVVFFAEGGGGRAGTGGKREGGEAVSDGPDIGGGRPLEAPTFATMARLSGLVPTIGINAGYCFAGNAVFLGCCDVVIATANSNAGMGGPAMIEHGGLGIVRPEEIGPMSTQVPNGTIDIAVEDEAEAVAAAKQYLSYFQGPVLEWDAEDQRLLRNLIPENRVQVYDIRKVIRTLADIGSVLELREGFGRGMITAMVRVEGRPMGLLANNPACLGGAIDRDGADKAARFMQLCDAFDLPLLVLCDTPGMMVGPQAEEKALVRHASRLFVTGSNLTIPQLVIVLRKAYGLGAQAMACGSFKSPFCTVAWPTGEIGGMGLEGQIRLGYRAELDAIQDPEARSARYEELVAKLYDRGKALSMGVSFAVDDVIDPAESRDWIASALRSIPSPSPRTGKKRPNIDTW